MFLLYIHVYHKWRSYDIWLLKYKVRQTEIFVILGHFLPFQPRANQENQILKLKKNTWRYHFTHLHYKWKSYDVCFLRYGARQTTFLSFWTLFCPFTSLRTQKLKFWENEKKTWRYYYFTNVYHEWRSYDVWFLKYGVQRTEFFVILDRFLPLYKPKNWHFEKMKKTPDRLSFYSGVP